MKLENIGILLFLIFGVFQQPGYSKNQIEHPIKNNSNYTSSQEASGGIKGLVVDEKGIPLFSANVIIIGTTFGAATNFEGKYRIGYIPSGKYKLQVSYVGYTKKIVQIEIVENRFIETNFNLKPESFSVGGITVTAKEDLLPRDIATKTDISSGEIEHYQATNLGDVLDLVPGI